MTTIPFNLQYNQKATKKSSPWQSFLGSHLKSLPAGTRFTIHSTCVGRYDPTSQGGMG